MARTDSTIFVVDDDASVRKGLTRLLRSAGWDSEAYATAKEFLTRPAYGGVGCVVLDVSMPDITGLELRDQLTARKISLPVIFLTGHGNIPTGVDAMKKALEE